MWPVVPVPTDSVEKEGGGWGGVGCQKDRYYSQQWLDESHDRVLPHRDMEVVRERKKMF